MRTLAAVSLAVAATAIAGAGAAPSATVATAKPGARVVSYLFHAQFDLEYDIEWVETSGDRTADCSSWSDDRGTNHVSAGSTTWIPGRATIFSRPNNDPNTGGWADLTATGARLRRSQVPTNAEADVKRRLVQRGGTTPGCLPPGPAPFRAPATDCGERSYKTKFAILRADTVRGKDSLRELTDRQRDRRYQRIMAITITAVPMNPAPLFRKCQTSAHAPEFPAYLPITVKTTDVAALRRLGPGERYRFGRNLSGLCEEDLPDTSTCYYTLNIEVTIRRWNGIEGDYP